MAYKRPRKDKRKQGAAHLDYEIGGWAATGSALVHAGRRPTLPDVLHRALLESHIVHGRALVAAMNNRRPHKEDVLFRDYFGNAEWTSMKHRFALPRHMQKFAKDASIFVAHVSYSRADERRQHSGQWNHKQFNWIGKRLKWFHNALGSEEKTWFLKLAAILG